MRKRILIPLATVLALSACREAPEPIGIGPHPADIDAPTRSARYRPVSETMRDYKIVTPQPWDKSNERVAPPVKP